MKCKTIALLAIFLYAASITKAQQWTIEKANTWQKNQGWLVGANYSPAYAINQLEFWQEDTFNIKEIDKEFRWAKQIGMNCMRVYLHHKLRLIRL